jgi:hypothetical protein
LSWDDAKEAVSLLAAGGVVRWTKEAIVSEDVGAFRGKWFRSWRSRRTRFFKTNVTKCRFI